MTKWRLLRCASPKRHFGRDLHVGARTRFWAPESIEIGEHTYIGKDVHVETNCRIGRYVLIANRVGLVGRNDHDFRTIGVPVRFGRWIGSVQSPSPHRGESVQIEDDVWIGFGATVLSGVVIGRGAIVAAGSVVTRNIERYSIVAGNPARPVGRRFESDEDVSRHELMVKLGRFESSERGYDFWTIQPGEPQ